MQGELLVPEVFSKSFVGTLMEPDKVLSQGSLNGRAHVMSIVQWLSLYD